MSEQKQFGPFEIGVIRGKTVDEHVAHLRLSLGGDEVTGPVDLYGVFLKGTETPAAHTGNGALSLEHAGLFAAAPDLLAALAALVAKLEAVHADPEYQSVWAVAQLHRGQYIGPTYMAELDAARVALAKAEPAAFPGRGDV